MRMPSPLESYWRPARAAQHLHHVQRAELRPAALFGAVNLRALDDDGVGGQVDSPGESGGGNEDFNVALSEQIFREQTIQEMEPGVVDGESVRQEIFHVQTLPMWRRNPKKMNI